MRTFKTAFITLAAIAFSAIPAITSAAPVTLGFEGQVANDDSIVGLTPYWESGYQLSNSSTGTFSNGIFGKDASNSNGSATYVFCAYDSSCFSGTAITLTGSQPFSLKSIDVGNWQANQVAGTLELIGTLAGGGTVSAVLDTGTAWATHLLAGFDMLSSVEFRGHTTYAVAFDNLVLETGQQVPEPGSLALATLALAGLGLRGRRQAR